LVIVDEAHHLRNRATLNWKFANRIKSKYLLLLTATPAQNDLDDLYNLITLLSPGQLRTAKEFRDEFVQRGDRRQPKNQTKLRELMMDVMVRNTRSQVGIDLPPRRAFTLRISLSKDERTLYDATADYVRKGYQNRGSARLMAHTLQAEAGSSAQALHATLTVMRKNQKKRDAALDDLCDLAAAVTSSSKAVALLESLREHGEKVLIFTGFRETQRFLREWLEDAGIPCAVFGGDLSAAEKDAQVAAFAGDKRALISTDVGSEGRNLQFCRNLVNFDLPWNPMRIEQRVGRVHRIGQKNTIHIVTTQPVPCGPV
jgi:SNF2 family DNA or RNA helicase